MGQRHCEIGTLLRLVAFVYIFTLVVILFKVHSSSFDSMLNEKSTHEKLNETVYIVRNVTKYIYVNNRVIVYQDKESAHYGPGENGTKVALKKEMLSNETLNRTETNKKFHGFNTLLSDVISLHRTVPDMRPQACKDKVYPDNLPAAGAVIIFRDEWHSIVLRTAYSILEHSPPELIKEVILVDDGSVDEDLKAIIDVHVAAVEKFRLVTNPKPLGLMMARQTGIEAVTAEIFVVMDGHMEVGPGWLEPLVNRLVEVPTALLCSHVGAIMGEDFEYRVDDPTNYNFDSQFPFFDPLTLDQQWAFYRESYRAKRNHSIEPLEYGTIQGMMAVMRKDFFMRMGGFDPGMKVWGTEQMELSFKVWMCGGRVEMIPCSKVAHMYRVTPWAKVNASSDHASANKRRTMDVWMDEPYRSFAMDYISTRTYDTGDISTRLRIRRNNNCKPYQYYVDKVKEFTDAFFPSFIKARATVVNREFNRCLDVTGRPNTTDEFDLLLYECHGNDNQQFILSDADQIRSHSWKIVTTAVNGTEINIKVLKSVANMYEKGSYWDYRPENTIYNRDSGLCLTALSPDEVGLRTCSNKLMSQTWAWKRVDGEPNGKDL